MMQACYAVVVLGTSTSEATTCNLLAVAAVTVSISPDTSIKSLLINSIVPAFPESSDTNIEDTNVVIKGGHVYITVAVAVVKSNLTFLYLDVLSTLAMLYPY